MAIPIVTDRRLQSSLANARENVAYHIEFAKETFSDELWQAMTHRGLNQVAFAERAGVTKQFLTKVFRGANCTIETMAKLAHALDYRLSIHIAPKECQCEWLHFAAKNQPSSLTESGLDLWLNTDYKTVKPSSTAQAHATITTTP